MPGPPKPGDLTGAYIWMLVRQTLRLCMLLAWMLALTLAWCVVLAIPLALGLGDSLDSPVGWIEALGIRIAIVSPGAFAFGLGVMGVWVFRLAFWTVRRRFDRMMANTGLRAGPHGLYGREYRGGVGGIDLVAVLEFVPYHVTRAEPRLLLTARGEIGAHAELRLTDDPDAGDHWAQGIFGNAAAMDPSPTGLEHVVVRVWDEDWCRNWVAQPGVTAAIDELLRGRFGDAHAAIRLRHDFLSTLYNPVDPTRVSPDEVPPLLQRFATLVRAAGKLPVSSRPSAPGAITAGGHLGLWRIQIVAANVVRTLVTLGSLGLAAAGILWMAAAMTVMCLSLVPGV